MVSSPFPHQHHFTPSLQALGYLFRKEYLMIYRGPGFLAVIWRLPHPPSPASKLSEYKGRAVLNMDFFTILSGALMQYITKLATSQCQQHNYPSLPTATPLSPFPQQHHSLPSQSNTTLFLPTATQVTTTSLSTFVPGAPRPPAWVMGGGGCGCC
jgi:hypothetical protein